jgi:AraC-like DNA-binding protein
VAARRSLALTPATVLLLPAARRYRFEFAPGLRLMGFHFQLEAVPGRDVLGDSVRLQRRAGDARRLAAAWKAFAADDAGAWFAVEAVLRQHLAELVRLPWAAVDAALLMQRRWSAVLEDLERLGARRAVAACAHRQGLSREGFSRRFHRDLGLSPSAWLAQRLADRARARLRGSDASLAAIAAELGFSDGFALSRFLKRVTGLRPSAIRAAPPGP